MFPSDHLPRFIVRLPVDLRQWLSDQAKRDAISQNAVLIHALRAAQELQSKKAEKS